MTGSGSAAGSTECGDLRVELRSVNARGFVLKQRLCAEVAGLEPAFEERIRRVVARGTVTLVVERVGAVFADRLALQRLVAELRALAGDLGLPDDLTLRDVLSLAGSFERTEHGLQRELPPRLADLLRQALDDLQRHRDAEGRATVAAVRAQLDELDVLRARAAARAPAVVAALRERLHKRIGEALADQGFALQPADLVREVALLADRVDVAEELQRLAAHGEAMRAALDAGSQLGRRLEFLAQEVWREANTLGSKSPDVEMAHFVVAMKSCIDKLKEQVANLE
jgi:uncharacterized protein (TIGR00255 family)